MLTVLFDGKSVHSDKLIKPLKFVIVFLEGRFLHQSIKAFCKLPIQLKLFFEGKFFLTFYAIEFSAQEQSRKLVKSSGRCGD